jgi:hypothetical protein
MSVELERARQQLAVGDSKKAVATLWLVEAKARVDFREAQGLVEIATQLHGSSEGRIRKDAELLLRYGEEYMASLAGQDEAFEGALVVIRPLTFLGGFGYPLEVRRQYDLVFTAEGFRVVERQRKVVVEGLLREVDDLDISGSVKEFEGRFVGGGFGLTGAVEGMAIATVLNALSAGTEINTVVRIQTRTGELFFHTSSIAPAALRMELSPVFTQLRGQSRQEGASPPEGDKIERLAKLADLLDRGVINAEEFGKLKADLLS